jgi:para-nitrobenzyl esterase
MPCMPSPPSPPSPRVAGRRRFLVPCLVAITVLLAGCEQGLAPPGEGLVRYRDLIFGSAVKTANILYGTAVNQQGATVELRLDVYQPAGDTVTSRPLVVFVHGGSFCCGSRTSPEIVDEATTLAREGYVTASISYRLVAGGCTGSVPVTVCVTAINHAREDAQSAIRFLRSNAAAYGIDPTRIAVAGTSAGGITAANVAFSSSDDPAASVRAGVALSGASIGPLPNAGDASLFLMHGTADTIVPYAWAVNTRDAGIAAGVRTVLTTWEGAGHVPYSQFRTQILEETRNFLWWHMDLAHAAT